MFLTHVTTIWNFIYLCFKFGVHVVLSSRGWGRCVKKLLLVLEILMKVDVPYQYIEIFLVILFYPIDPGITTLTITTSNQIYDNNNRRRRLSFIYLLLFVYL